MPFDTTYHIKTQDINSASSITVPGGRDTSIYLERQQLPPHIDSLFKMYDSILMSEQQSRAINYEPNEHYKLGRTMIWFFVILLVFIVIRVRQNLKTGNIDNESMFGDDTSTKRKPKNYLTYYGDEIEFSDAELAIILSKRFPYYRQLNLEHQSIFIHRLQKFMSEKTFKIHDKKGFKEMPVLISAAAIQLTFGLKKYLLPHFEFIHIYPQEFLRVEPVLCFLEGNVSGHAIKLSWKHFIEGYDNTADGQNTGLHELAHALYYQTFIVERNVDRGFRNYYDGYSVNADKAYKSEKSKEKNLYSEYAEKNLQEFWAESVEIFFEKPKEMRSEYSQLYESMKSILNQDPINHIPILSS